MDKDQNKTARNALLPLQQHVCPTGTSQPVSQISKHTHTSPQQGEKSTCGQGTRPAWTKTTDEAQERVKDEDTTSHQFPNNEEVGFES